MKKVIYLAILLCLIFGSNNYQELNSLAIITNIGIERKEDTYQVIFQEIIPKTEENKITKTYRYYTNSSKDLKHAFNNLNDDITKEIYLEHLENIIVKDDDTHIILELEKYLKSDLDNFNVILSDSNVKDILDYSSNYKYINSLIDDNITLRSIKKAKLEHQSIKVPTVKLENDRLVFYKYKTLGGKNL